MSVASFFPKSNALLNVLSYSYITWPILIVASVLVIQKLLTTVQYHRRLQALTGPPRNGSQIVSPPVIPYWVPWLGHTLSFMNQKPGKFWQDLIAWHPRQTGICTLVVGGRQTHIVYSPTAVQALFRAKGPNRDIMEQDMFREVFCLPPDQVHTAEATRGFEVSANARYLNSFERVNELTAHFTQSLDTQLASDADQVSRLAEVPLYTWLRERMFTASCDALFGANLLKMYPSFGADFVKFDVDVLRFLFQTPKFLLRDAITRRTRIFANLEKWSTQMLAESGGAPVDPDAGPAWEPCFGSRYNRARQRDYALRNLSRRTGAALDAGLTFGLASNVIPATGWMLFHILSPRAPADLLPRVRAEIEEAVRSDGSLDVAKLIAQPLLQSVFNETLRLYTDALVARSLPEDLILPVDEDDKCRVSLRKGDFLLVPSWLGHRDGDFWAPEGASIDAFDADRFLERDEKTGKVTFNMGRTTGKFLPFGGGRTICPGRTFAKQEAIGALAMVLLRFDFEFKGFVDADEKPTKNFPGLQSSLPGSGVLAPGGDMRVKIRRRQ